MALAILGVTGYTGRLVLDEARRAGLDVRLVGRRREALEELASAGEEVRVADARDEAALQEAFAGAAVVASLAGPFLEVGLAPPRAAAASGAHYLDTSGEQAWVRLLHDELRAETVVLPAFGFDYVPGDLAARLAAEQVEGPLDEIVVAYSVKGVGTSRGTRRTIGHVLDQDQVAWEDGRLVGSAFRLDDPDGALPVRRAHRGGVGRHRAADRAAPHRRPQRALLHPRSGLGREGRRARPAGSTGRPARLAGSGPSGPSEASRRQSRFAVVAEARGPGGEGRAVVVGSDVYGLTARLIVGGAQALIAGEVRGSWSPRSGRGVRCATLAGRLEPLLAIAD